MSRVMITVPNELLSEFEQMAQIEHRSRSELICEAMRYYLKQIDGKSLKPSLSFAPREAIGIIERLRVQAEERALKAHNTTELICSFRGALDDQK